MSQGKQSDAAKRAHTYRSWIRHAKLTAAARQAVQPIFHAEILEQRILLSGLTTVASFNPWALGAQPYSTPVADGAGNLYGTTSAGGAYNVGTVFEWVKATNTVTLVATFNIENGAMPEAGVVFDSSGNLYGTTQSGGANGLGTVYEIAAGSNTITTLASTNLTSFSDYPFPSVVLDSAGDVFGTIPDGGIDNLGSVYEIVKGSGAITTVASFNFSTWGFPAGGLVMDGHGNLYGTTIYGDSNLGNVYEIAAGSNTIQNIASFNDADGLPVGGIVLDSHGNIFGTTQFPSLLNQTAVYEIAAGTNTVSLLASFNSPGNNQPYGAPILDGAGNLYGTTGDGQGFVFELPNGSNSVTFLAAVASEGGEFPVGGLVMDGDGNIYGTTLYGGNSNFRNELGTGGGTLFEIPAGSNSITTLSTFSGDGAYGPSGDVLVDQSGNIYGTTYSGGSAGFGAIFEVAAGSNVVTTLASFSTDVGSGSYVNDTLGIDAAGTLYGTTTSGGIYNDGTVFELLKGSNEITTLASFNGFGPAPGVVLDAQGNIFGLGGGGANGGGTVWEVANGSNTINVLASFNAFVPGEYFSQGTIALDSSDDVFGATPYGGPAGDGTVYEVVNGSDSVTTLASFNGVNGSLPRSGVTIDGNGNVYGTTSQGVAGAAAGTVFEVVKGSGAITTLADFNSADAPFPTAPVVVDAVGNVFGTIYFGDVGFGALFEIASGSQTITTLASFNNSTDYETQNGLAIDTYGNLFGVSLRGEAAQVGGIFELPSVATVAPEITSFTVNGGAAQRSMVTQATVVFNQSVNLATGAISIVQRTTGSGTPTPITFVQSSTDNTTWNLTFPGYTGGSLPDGIFDLTVTAADVTSVSTPTLAMTGGNQISTFDRLFGDIDGNGIVNNADYFQFKKAFGQLTGGPTFNAAFDYDANGVINNADYFQFKKRFGQQIVIAAESQLSSDAALLANLDSSSHKDKTSKLLL
jgi:uncharacterized repeat protein (TIGR03803 family)